MFGIKQNVLNIYTLFSRHIQMNHDVITSLR